ncbi:hypothetical protein [Acinetobacter sp. ANC 4641]|uniref:hypothetical protein n=1 Tax=Acinetobacter sp. ANC 4641 TaxID=2529847 RepID=UPI001038DAEC|nr:hypothetical protein [Acinetobacter sp. ANC 4641]TCB09571.1 hypothetical protein E0H78_10605 [Acinetobacter sp. ANC 4641]
MQFNPFQSEIDELASIAERRMQSHAKDKNWLRPSFSLSFKRVRPGSDIGEITYTFHNQKNEYNSGNESYELIGSKWKPHSLFGD